MTITVGQVPFSTLIFRAKHKNQAPTNPAIATRVVLANCWG